MCIEYSTDGRNKIVGTINWNEIFILQEHFIQQQKKQTEQDTRSWRRERLHETTPTAFGVSTCCSIHNPKSMRIMFMRPIKNFITHLLPNKWQFRFRALTRPNNDLARASRANILSLLRDGSHLISSVCASLFYIRQYNPGPVVAGLLAVVIRSPGTAFWSGWHNNTVDGRMFWARNMPSWLAWTRVHYYRYR